MAEMEDKFQEILGNEDAMSQIMSLAQSFSSPSGAEEGNSKPSLGAMDPQMLALGQKLLAAYQSQHRSVVLMNALRPLVSEERHEMMDRLATASRLSKVVSCLLELWGEKLGNKEGEDV